MQVSARLKSGQTSFNGSIERVGERLCVIAPRGELDAYSFGGFQAELLGADAGDVVVDLTEVTFIESTALGAIVQASKRARGRGDRLIVVSSDPHVRKVLEVTGFLNLVRLERTLCEAVAQALDR